MATRLKFCIIFTACLFLISCKQSQPEAAQCRVDQQFLTSLIAGGACITKINQKLMVMVDPENRLNIPQQAKINGKSAQCAAHQAVWQSTGFNVEVGPRLGQLNNGIELYACSLDAGLDGTETFSVPEWSQSKNNMIKFINPYEYSAYDWENPDDHVKVLDAYISIETTQQLFESSATAQDTFVPEVSAPEESNKSAN